jgi:transcriptional regulator with XRE-family HTH domain
MLIIGGEPLHIPLGENIRRLRQQYDLTQRVLAHHLCVSEQAVSKWETGLSFPDLYLLVAIADYFSVSLDTLLGREPKTP